MHTEKVRTNITINKNLLEKAREHDICISSFLDIELRRYLSLIERRDSNDFSFNIDQSRLMDDYGFRAKDSKSNNTVLDSSTNSRARGVAWYPSTLGW